MDTQLRAAVQELRVLRDGYAFRFPLEVYRLAADFIDLERRCCPFPRFGLDLEPDADALWLRLTGRPGTKEFLQAELQLPDAP